MTTFTVMFSDWMPFAATLGASVLIFVVCFIVALRYYATSIAPVSFVIGFIALIVGGFISIFYLQP